MRPGKAFDFHVPLIIIGTGACGLVSVLRANDAGVEIFVLEQDDTPSGLISLSSGFVPAAGTRFQADAGIEDGPANFARDIRNKARGTARRHLAEAAAAHCGPTLEWLAERHGLEWIIIDDFLYPGHSRYRMHAVPERTGSALMARLSNAAETAGIPVATDARATGLFVDGTVVRGVEATGVTAVAK